MDATVLTWPKDRFKSLDMISFRGKIFWLLPFYNIKSIDGFVISQNLAQSRKGRKVNLLTLKDIFLAPLASLRENIVFRSSSSIEY